MRACSEVSGASWASTTVFKLSRAFKESSGGITRDRTPHYLTPAVKCISHAREGCVESHSGKLLGIRAALRGQLHRVLSLSLKYSVADSEHNVQVKMICRSQITFTRHHSISRVSAESRFDEHAVHVVFWLMEKHNNFEDVDVVRLREIFFVC